MHYSKLIQIRTGSLCRDQMEKVCHISATVLDLLLIASCYKIKTKAITLH